MIVAMVLAALSLVPWLGVLFISFFLFDAPDAADKPLLGAAALAIWTISISGRALPCQSAAVCRLWSMGSTRRSRGGNRPRWG